MAKLVAIGDSLTQGFQSGAIFNTEWSYPAMMARALNLQVPNEYRVPPFPGSGLPLNIEDMLRWMEQKLGDDLDTIEWVVRFPQLLSSYIDRVEDLYERGAGAQPIPFSGVYHNLAVWGFRVADAYTVTSGYARQAIDDAEGLLGDDPLISGLPAAPMYRTARRVLNPPRVPEREEWTMLDNLKQIVADEGVEQLIIWLGSNDCLGTVLDLKVRFMYSTEVVDDPQERRQWNLTHPVVFEQDFAKLIDQVNAIIPATTRVFVGTIAHVTIPPVTTGLGAFDGTYFDYYGRFFATEDHFSRFLHTHLTRAQAAFIDRTIDQYNAAIRRLVKPHAPQWQVVDVGDILDKLAVKRNQMQDEPDRPLRDYYQRLGRPDHPLLQLTPVPNVLRLRTLETGLRYNGGLFSLDCFHPSTIGYGIVAEAFLHAMQQAGVPGADPLRLDWDAIIAQDGLVKKAPRLWDDVTEAAEKHPLLWNLIFQFLG
jgi:lysophospholipase L1-like esterase/ligand-binding SRPBCC domain-containing protein